MSLPHLPRKELYAVTRDNVIALVQPDEIVDPLTEVLREGARLLLAQAVEAEVSVFLASHEDLTLPDGRRRLARHGHLPERQIQTGIGAVKRQPRVRDRAGDSDERIRFSPSILPHYARRTKSLEVLIPWLYLNGISSGDFREALVALLGKDAPNLSADTVLRLRQTWQGELERCEGRDLSARRYVYVWGRRGIYLQAIWMAAGKTEAEKAFDTFLAKYAAKYDKAARCLEKDRDVLQTFFEPQTRSRAPSRPFAIERSDPKAACRARPRRS